MMIRTLSCWWSGVLVSLTLLLLSTAASAQQSDAGRRNQEVSPLERQEWIALANARFMTGKLNDALDALNRIGEPRISSVKIEGLVRTRREVVDEYLGLKPGELLTAGKLTRIQRRLEELPSASSASVRFDPIAGSAIVTPIVVERSVFPHNPFDWTPVGIRAAFVKEIRVQVANPTGSGEVWSPSYRWSANRPRAMLQFDAPAPGKLPGVVRLETFWERQTYESPSLGKGLFKEERFRAGAGLSDWITSWLRWDGGAAVDHIEFATYLGLDGSLNARAFGDRFAMILSGGQWFAGNRGDSFSTGELVLTARSSARRDVPVVTMLAGIALASEMAPLTIWPGAGAGQGRAALLRAHPLILEGILSSEVFGRELFFTSTEYEYPMMTTFGTIGIAGFVDAAQAQLRLDPTTPSMLHVDVGGGVRFNTSRSGNKVRVDVGYGLRDGRVRLSAGYVLPWGRRP